MDQTFQPAQPQFIVMPVPQRNALGVLGFFVALIGLLVPTGIVALLGLILSLAAIGRSPRGFATMGVILGVLGSAFWLGVMLVAVMGALVVALGVALLAIGAFVLVHPEVIEITSDMTSVALAIEEYRQENSTLPDGVAALPVGVATTIDPWGATYRLALLDEEPGYDVISGGPDRAFDTDDDVRLSTLDRTWEGALETFDDRIERFGDQLERLDADDDEWEIGLSSGDCAKIRPLSRIRRVSAESYEQAARHEVVDEAEEAVAESADEATEEEEAPADP